MAYCRRVRYAVRSAVLPVIATAREEAGPYMASLSRRRDRGRSPNGVAARRRWAARASVGWRVTLTGTTRRAPSATMKHAWGGRKRRSVTGRQSPAQIAPAWWRRSVAQGCPVRRGGRASGRSRRTVDVATRMSR